MIFLWIILCILVGILGTKKKIGGAGAFFLSLFLSPLIGLLITLLSKERNSISNMTSLLIVLKNGNDRTLPFKKININTPYIQKSPTTGMYKVYQKTKEKEGINCKFLKEFKDFTEAKNHVLTLYK